MIFLRKCRNMGLERQGLYLPEFEHDNCGAGFICSLQGKKSNDIIHKALEILDKLEHRGAVSADGKTGDGAGILIDIPHDFFKSTCSFELPDAGDYATGNVFLPNKENQREFCEKTFEKNIKKQGLELLGWRNVPVNKSVPGRIAAETEPFVKQIFVAKGEPAEHTHRISWYKHCVFFQLITENYVIIASLNI